MQCTTKKLFRRRNLVRPSRCLIDNKKTVLPAVDEVQEPPDSMATAAARLRDQNDVDSDEQHHQDDDDDNGEFFFDSIESSLATSASSKRPPPECDSIDLSQPDSSLPAAWPAVRNHDGRCHVYTAWSGLEKCFAIFLPHRLPPSRSLVRPYLHTRVLVLRRRYCHRTRTRTYTIVYLLYDILYFIYIYMLTHIFENETRSRSYCHPCRRPRVSLLYT